MAQKSSNAAVVWGRCAQSHRRLMNHLLSRWTIFIIAFSVMVILSAPMSAQVSKEYQLKAVFLWRLVQFAEWPNDAFESEDSPLVICLLGENTLVGALESAVRGETAHGRTLIVQLHRTVDQIRTCHLLYITGAGPRQAKEISAALVGRSVLTVGDVGELPNSFETIVQFITDENKIKLRISLKRAAAARLMLDPRLLRAAETVAE